MPLHLSQLRKQLVELTAEAHSQLTPFAQELFVSLYEELCNIDERLGYTERLIQRAFQHEESCQKIAEIEGVGPVIATAMIAALADGRALRNGRQLAAWLGLVPRQHSSAGLGPDAHFVDPSR